MLSEQEWLEEQDRAYREAEDRLRNPAQREDLYITVRRYEIERIRRKAEALPSCGDARLIGYYVAMYWADCAEEAIESTKYDTFMELAWRTVGTAERG